MSTYNSQELNDSWDDIPANFQEQNLQNIVQLESAAFASRPINQVQPSSPSHDARHNKKHKRDHTDGKSDGFQVYKDPPLSIAEINSPSAKRKILVDTTNQQQQQQQQQQIKVYPTKPNPTTQPLPSSPLTDKTTTASATPTPTPTNHTDDFVQTNDQFMIDDNDDDNIWLEFDDMDIPALLDYIDKSNTNSNDTAQQTNDPGTVDTTIATLAQYDNVLQAYGGFQTAGSRKDIKPSGNSLKAAHDKALALMSEPLSPPTTTTEADATLSTCSTTTSSNVPDFTSGFTTASGTKLNEPSLDAKYKAQQLLLNSPTRPSSLPPSMSPTTVCPTITTSEYSTDCEAIVDTKHKTQQVSLSSPTRPSSSSPTPSSANDFTATSLTKAPQDLLDTSLSSIYQYEDVIQQYGGFSKASGKKSDTVISDAAKQQALLLFSSDTFATQLPQPSSHQEISQNDINTSLIEGNTTSTSDITPIDGSAVTATTHSLSTSSLVTTSLSSVDMHAPDHIVVSQSSPSSSPAPPITKSTSTLHRKRRQTGTRTRSKPFKSPAVNLELVKAGLEKRKTVSSVKRMKGPSVFDLHYIGCRRPLSSLGPPKKYTKADLNSMNIPPDIIDMSPCKARSYMFENNWGVQEATNDLLSAGALSSMLPVGWVENHYGWIVFKLARHLSMFAHHYKDDDTWWSPAHVLKQLLYRYERDINLGQRSVLKRIMEQDDVPVKQMVLMVSDIVSLSTSNSSDMTPGGNGQHKYRLQLTDGWYQISTYVDARMNKMIDQGRVNIGQKLTMTGAQLTGDRTPKTPLEALTMASAKNGPDSHHDSTTTSLRISSNSCLPCSWDTKLGYPRQRLRRHVIRRLDTNVYEDGGLITMMDVMICKKYPMMYSETLANGLMVKRNSKDEEDYRRTLEIRQQTHCHPSSQISILEKDVVSQDRRVSGYFRLRICDVGNNNSNTYVQATLLVSQATEVTHMDLLEGQCYRLFFVQPYQPKTRPLDGLYLITTRLTKWEPLPPKTTNHTSTLKDSSTTDLLKYPLRSICSCANTKYLTGTDVDIVVLVLHTQPQITQRSIDERNVWLSTLLVTDSSSTLCQITYRSYYRPAQNMNGQILGLMNVRFDTYDSKCNIIHIKSSDETEIWTKPTGAMVFMHRAMTDLKLWIESHPGDLASMQQRVKDLTQQ